jgi:hypothetical protein
MGIICSAFLRGRDVFFNVFQKQHCFPLSEVFHVCCSAQYLGFPSQVVSRGCCGTSASLYYEFGKYISISLEKRKQN